MLSESEYSDDRLGHDGNAQDVFRPDDEENEVLRGEMSSSESLGDGGGGGGMEDGDGEDAALLPNP